MEEIVKNITKGDAMEISICVGSACHLKGSYDVIKSIETLVKDGGLEDRVIIKAAFCLGQCTKAVSVKFEGDIYSVRKETVEEFFKSHVMKRLRETEAQK